MLSLRSGRGTQILTGMYDACILYSLTEWEKDSKLNSPFKIFVFIVSLEIEWETLV